MRRVLFLTLMGMSAFGFVGDCASAAPESQPVTLLLRGGESSALDAAQDVSGPNDGKTIRRRQQAVSPSPTIRSDGHVSARSQPAPSDVVVAPQDPAVDASAMLPEAPAAAAAAAGAQGLARFSSASRGAPIPLSGAEREALRQSAFGNFGEERRYKLPSVDASRLPGLASKAAPRLRRRSHDSNSLEITVGVVGLVIFMFAREYLAMRRRRRHRAA